MPSTASDPTRASAATRGTAVPGATTALVLLVSINLLNYIDRYVLSAVVPFIEKTNPTFFSAATTGDSALAHALMWIQHTFGFTPYLALMGSLSTAFMATYMLAAPVFGRLAERRSRWALIGVGVVLWSFASGASGLAGAFLALLITRCFVGIGEAAYGPVAPALISDLYAVRKRGQVLAWFYMAIPVGSALGFIIGDAIARSTVDELGRHWLGISAESWRWAFYLLVAPGLLLGLWSFFRRDVPRGATDDALVSEQHRVQWRDYRVPLRTKSYVYCTIGMTAMTFAMGGMSFWMPSTTSRHIGTSATTALKSSARLSSWLD